jgi:glutathione S-transferase
MSPLLRLDDGSRDLIAYNDGDFKHWLDRYKYADRHPEHSAEHYRQQAESFIEQLESVLAASPWLGGASAGFVDMAVFPFIRQFAGVDSAWFSQSTYPRVREWLQCWLDSALFNSVMAKYPKQTAPAAVLPLCAE